MHSALSSGPAKDTHSRHRRFGPYQPQTTAQPKSAHTSPTAGPAFQIHPLLSPLGHACSHATGMPRKGRRRSPISFPLRPRRRAGKQSACGFGQRRAARFGFPGRKSRTGSVAHARTDDLQTRPIPPISRRSLNKTAIPTHQQWSYAARRSSPRCAAKARRTRRLAAAAAPQSHQLLQRHRIRHRGANAPAPRRHAVRSRRERDSGS